jgi:hypothetical protein
MCFVREEFVMLSVRWFCDFGESDKISQFVYLRKAHKYERIINGNYDIFTY